LLPLSPPLTPFEPSESAGYLELLSDHTDPTVAEAQVLDEKFAKQDSITYPGASPNDTMLLDSAEAFALIYSPILSILNSDSPPTPKKRKAADFKVEVPLTPLNQDSMTPAKKVKSVSFPEMLHEYIPKNKTTTTETQDVTFSSQASVDAFFEEIIEPIALEANRSIEQEQLQEADSLLRVPIPVIDFSQPTVPWKTHSRKANGKYPEGQTELMAQRKLLVQMKQSSLMIFSSWPSVMKLERQLHWTAIPRELAKVAFEEHIDDDRYMAVVRDDMGQEDVVVSDSLTWKLDGLRILDDLDESEDELEPVDVDNHYISDMEETLRKRKRVLLGSDRAYYLNTELEPDPQAQKTGIPVKNQGGRSYQQAPLSAAVSRPSANSQGSNNTVGGNMFSTSTALSNFMKSQGRIPTVLKSLSTLASQNVYAMPILPASKSTLGQANESSAPLSVFIPDKKDSQTTPWIPPDPDPKSFVISTALFRNHRPLMRVIGALYRQAILYERDFTALPTITEADLILSPTTGIILTTLQKIKQRSLPGQKVKIGGTEDRLSGLNDKYERVLLLVHEGLTPTGISRDLDKRDYDCLTKFKEFVRVLEYDVQVVYVPGGSEELGKWIVSYMVEYGRLETENVLKHEDTLASHLLTSSVSGLFSNQAFSGNKHYVEQVSIRSQPKSCLPSCLEVSILRLRCRTLQVPTLIIHDPRNACIGASKLLMT
jgi:hypothetical protein